MSARHEHVGPTEAAHHLGLSRSRFYQLRNAYADFPKPVAELSSGAVWHLADIERWQRKHPTRPAGRPRTAR